MKKIAAVVLALVMVLLCLSGCSNNNKPTHYTDAENLEVKLYPNSKDGETFASGINAIQIIINTPNVESGAGEIAIYKSSNDELIAVYDVRLDNKEIYMNTGTDPAYAQIIIPIPEDKTFEAGESYYVTMDEKCFYVDDIKGYTEAAEKGDWEFTIANYGYDGNVAEMPITYLSGTTVSIPIKLADEAVQAILLYDNVSVVSAERRALSESGTFEIETLQAGTATISVMFLDKDGYNIDTLGFSITVK